MTEKKIDWIPNFVPGSTSVGISAALEQVPDLHRMGLDDFENWLENYRIEAGLEQVNLRQLRDWVVYEASIAPSNKRASRIRIVGLVTDLIDHQGRTISSS